MLVRYETEEYGEQEALEMVQDITRANQDFKKYMKRMGIYQRVPMVGKTAEMLHMMREMNMIQGFHIVPGSRFIELDIADFFVNFEQYAKTVSGITYMQVKVEQLKKKLFEIFGMDGTEEIDNVQEKVCMKFKKGIEKFGVKVNSYIILKNEGEKS